MVTHYHRDIKVEWTDGEWERLQKIKRGERSQNIKTNHAGDKIINIRLPEWLHERAKAYADSRGLTMANIVRDVLYVLTQ